MIWLTGRVYGYNDWADFTIKDLTEAAFNYDETILYVRSDIGEVPVVPETIKMGRTPPGPGWEHVGRGYVRRTEKLTDSKNPCA